METIDKTKITKCHQAPVAVQDTGELKCSICGAVITEYTSQKPTKSPTTKDKVVKATEQPKNENIEQNNTLENVTNYDYKPYKNKEYETYKIWRQLPSTIRGQKQKILLMLGFDMALLPLLQIRTQKEFAEKFGVSENSIVLWNQRIAEEGETIDERFAWAKQLTKNLIFALYRGGLKDGDASKVKLFLQYIENFEEKSGIKVEDDRETTKLRNELHDLLSDATGEGNSARSKKNKVAANADVNPQA